MLSLSMVFFFSHHKSQIVFSPVYHAIAVLYVVRASSSKLNFSQSVLLLFVVLVRSRICCACIWYAYRTHASLVYGAQRSIYNIKVWRVVLLSVMTASTSLETSNSMMTMKRRRHRRRQRRRRRRQPCDMAIALGVNSFNLLLRTFLFINIFARVIFSNKMYFMKNSWYGHNNSMNAINDAYNFTMYTCISHAAANIELDEMCYGVRKFNRVLIDELLLPMLPKPIESPVIAPLQGGLKSVYACGKLWYGFKFLRFVFDLSAFKPGMWRLECLRDDVIFDLGVPGLINRTHGCEGAYLVFFFSFLKFRNQIKLAPLRLNVLISFGSIYGHIFRAAQLICIDAPISLLF